ncbi:hypothetical protein LQD23_15820 [Chromobacterium violaceum]|uniref:hypothetical protein n=1 Tax=Chromobacterium violaceum TaxID=536 RepID=UPI001E41C19C|nr:hypothetical protein [Chromobacterium violaceum]MCD0493755.1 hypothetical protein [Chromobacterium violaceum]
MMPLEINWNTTKEIITNLSTLTSAVTTCFGCYIGFKGLSTWRKQLSGKANYSLAKKLMRATYRLNDQIKYRRFNYINFGPSIEKYNTRHPNIEFNEQKQKDKILKIKNKILTDLMEAKSLRWNHHQISDIEEYLAKTFIEFHMNDLKNQEIKREIKSDQSFIIEKYNFGDFFKEKNEDILLKKMEKLTSQYLPKK